MTVQISLLKAIVICIMIFLFSYLLIGFILKSSSSKSCVDKQRELIADFDAEITKAKETFQESIRPFEMKSCAKCIWYDKTAKGLEVIFLEEKEPILVKTENIWEWQYDSRDNALISPGYTYRFWINPYRIECLNCEGKVGACPV